MKKTIKKTANHIKKFAVNLYRFIKLIIIRMDTHKVPPRGAELAYYLVISALAAFVAIVYVAHYFESFISSIEEGLFLILPLEIAQWIMSVIGSVSVPGSIPILLGTIIAIIWFVSRAMHSMMRSFNIIYHTTDRGSLLKAKLFSILFTLALVVLFIVIFFLSVAQQAIGTFLQNNFEYNGFMSTTSLGMLISLISMMLVFTLLYYQLPNCKTGLAGSLPGAIFTTAVWFGISKIFSFYVNSLNALSWVLGSFGSIFIFLIWIYWLSIVVLIGAEINHIAIEKFKRKKSV